MTTLELPMQNASTSLRDSENASRTSPSRGRLWTGRVLSGLAVAFLTLDTVVKLIQHPSAVEGSAALGFPPYAVTVLGWLEALCLVLYLVPRTAVLGAVLWTGYLGGAIATHLRLDNPLFTHLLFPTYVAALLWGGLSLRDSRILPLLVARGASTQR